MVNQSKREPIAIVGIGCRFPGGVKDTESYWDLMMNGVDAITDVPKDRWDMRKYYDPDHSRPGKLYAKQAGFLKEKVERFDPMFFGISPREAEYMDPQQRLLLEVAWEAMEDAGLPGEQLQGSLTGVFIGGFCLDHKLKQLSPMNRHLLAAHSGTGSTMAILANRISYIFNLQGPSVSMDTACSSSLVATHYACQSIWNGECHTALAGGVNIMLKPEYSIAMSKGKFLSPESRCKMFDESASGYVRGEGAGIVLLKPLSQAQRDGDRVYAVIRGTGVNQDGHTNGMTVPSAEAQRKLIRSVYAQAGVSPGDIQYVEAHGTGTQAGDPIEASALHLALSDQREPDQKCWVGSVKTNIGHLEAAAGIAGLIKAALILKNKEIPPNLHFQHPNSKIPLDEYCIQVPVSPQPFPPSTNGSFVGVNSFGYGGTNAHVLLEEPPQPTLPYHSENGDSNSIDENVLLKRPVVLPLTAKDGQALKDLAASMLEMIGNRDPSQVSLQDVVYSAAYRQSHHPHRLAVTAHNRIEMIEKLRSFAEGGQPEYTVSGVLSADKQKIVFVMTGMGPQWWGMGRQLFQQEPVFKNTVEQCDQIFQAISGWSIKEAMLAEEEQSRMDETSVAQPANFVLQAALTDLWKSWGIEPDAVVGHSVGEVASAYASGSLSLEDALTVSYHRSRLQQTLAGQGGMLAVGLPESEAESLIEDEPKVSIAAVNSPTSVTLAGDREALERLAELLEEHDIFHRMLRVEVAYHSYQMDEIRDQLMQSLGALDPKAPSCQVYSTVTASRMEEGGFTAEYWWHNVRQPVRLNDVLKELFRDGYNCFVEVGPHPVLKSSIRECMSEYGVNGNVISSMHRGKREQSVMTEAFGALFVSGATVDWKSVNPTGRFVPLPKYPWQKELYTIESEASIADRLGLSGHPFLNQKVQSPNPGWEVELNDQFFPFLADHRIQNNVVFPGASYVEAGLAVHAALYGDEPCGLENVSFHRVLVSNTNGTQQLHLSCEPRTGKFEVHSTADDDGWVNHASGRIVPLFSLDGGKVHISDAIQRCKREVDVDVLYNMLERSGLQYGPSFRRMRKLWLGDKEIVVQIDGIDDSENNECYYFHPTLLDAGFQAMVAAVDGTISGGIPRPYIPVSLKHLSYYRRPQQQCWAYIRIHEMNDKSIVGQIQFVDDQGYVIMKVDQVKCKAIDDVSASSAIDQWLYMHEWKAVDAISEGISNTHAQADKVIVFAEQNEQGERFVQSLERNGIDTVLRTAKYFDRDSITECFGKLDEHDVYTILYLPGSDTNWQESNLSETLADKSITLAQLAQAAEKKFVHQKTRLVTVTQGGQFVTAEDAVDLSLSTLNGLTHVIASEYPTLECRLIDLLKVSDYDEVQYAVKDILAHSSEEEVAYRAGKRYIKQYIPYVPSSKEADFRRTKMVNTQTPVFLDVPIPGKIDSVVYREFGRIAPSMGQVEIKIHHCGINYKDLLKVLGQLDEDVVEGTYYGHSLGMESSGTIVSVGEGVRGFEVGDEVIAAVPGICSYANVDCDYVVHKPESMSMEQAPILIGFLTSYYGLVDVARLQPGEKVLIHNATGGVGLCAVQIAKWIGAEIFATAGSEEKRQILRDMGIEHVMNSRTLAFVDEIKQVTGGQGVDVVLNAIAGEPLRQSFSLLASYGRFIEIGKRDIAEDTGLGMRAFNNGLMFAAVDIDRLLKDRPKVMNRILKEVIHRIQEGDFHSLPITVFPASQAEDALRYMAQSKHVGKIVLSVESQQVEAIPMERKRLTVSRDGAYVITGGTRGLGLQIAKRFAEQGAGHLILLSRSGLVTEEAQEAVSYMEDCGAVVYAPSVDITVEGQLKEVLQHIRREGHAPIRGIVHGAVVLDDAYLKDLSKERFLKVLQPKVKGAMLLYRLTQNEPLDWFVSFSSISTWIGNPGQGNYVAANSALEAFAYHGRNQGRPVMTINLGVLSEVGVAARQENLEAVFKSTGINGFTVNEALAGFERILQLEPAQIGLFKVDWAHWGRQNASSQRSSRFSKLVSSSPYAESVTELPAVNELLEVPADQRYSVLSTHLVGLLANVLSIPSAKVDLHTSITNLGMDSLIAIEFRHLVQEQYGLDVTAMELLKGPSLAELTEAFIERLNLNVESRLDVLLERANEMSEEELDRNLELMKEGKIL